MKIDSTLSFAAIITLSSFVLLHYVIEPRKEKKRKKSEKFKNFYAPLYMMINARLSLIRTHGKRNGAKELYFSDAGSPPFINDNYMFEFVLENSSYASVKLLSKLDAYIRSCTESGGGDHEEIEELIKIVVKEYQQLRKELKLEYNKSELETGIPESIQILRNLHKRLVAES
ncbi:TPA: hypothetical protein ACGX4N_000683 [Bacillus cereus]|nr:MULTISPECIES: hypothetical protein [Bacillus cereus group]ANV73995.1 hypothetical protein BCM43_10015 [Bacillus thuringiensis]